MTEAGRKAAVVKLSPSFGGSVKALVEEAGFEVVERAPAEADPLSSEVAFTLVLAGGAEPEGLEWLAGSESGVPRYLVGAASDHRLALGAMQRGARDYFALPGDLDLLRRTLERLGREARAQQGAEGFAAAERSSTGFDAIVGKSAAVQSLLAQARRVAAVADVTVLIGGETGTGKELLARAIHLDSPRAKAPFVEINCAAIPANLLESELFGHERGAFTGAVAARPGLFELADGGTLFLDEIGNLPLELQPKILRALESRELRRVGGQTTRRFDVRVIAASHVDLGSAVATGGFREDLYYRLNVVHLVLPPLRDRGDDVELLAKCFLEALAAQHRLPVPPLEPAVRSALRAHPWPGNVRELRNAIERALVLSPRGTISLEELLLPGPSRQQAGTLPFPAPLATIIRAATLETLERVDGNKSEAARRLGISRPRLQRILDGDTE
jgi:DNA-binding NtrC family response regulator